MTRNGKIARLPKAIREELNQRLDEGETGQSLVDWLNGLPEVQAVLQAHFGGAEIREQNLSEWRKGGYVEWLRHQEAMELAERLYERAEEMRAKGEEQMPMSEVLSLWLSARYAVATEEIAAAGGEEGQKQLRQMCGDVAKLRRLDQQAQRLEQQERKIEQQRDWFELEQIEVKINWERWKLEKRVLEADVRKVEEKEAKEYKERHMTAEERARRIAEIYGVPYRGPGSAESKSEAS